MNDNTNNPPSPGPLDEIPPGTNPVDDSRLEMDMEIGNSMTYSLGHQGDKATGGLDVNLRVLYCSNINLSLDYRELHVLMKRFGTVERMKLKLATDKSSFLCYVTFDSSQSADMACKYLNGHSVNDSIMRTKLFRTNNINDEPCDFIPKNEDNEVASSMNRKLPIPVWHVATYKEGRENLIRAAECIEGKVGNIPEGNLKRYGRNILIKAGNDTQGVLLSNFKPPENGNIEKITAHKTFNTFKGVIFSRDLFEYSNEEILERCPSHVYEVKKLNETTHCILLIFSCDYVPDIISIKHNRIKVKKYRANPTQCNRCFEYGHVHDKCKSKRRCFKCSAEHESEHCTSERFCFHCKGSHSPNSRDCARKKFEQEVIEVANNQYIDIGSAKRQVMGANRHPNSSYASAIKLMKTRSAAQKAKSNSVSPERPSTSTSSHSPTTSNSPKRSSEHTTPNSPIRASEKTIPSSPKRPVSASISSERPNTSSNKSDMDKKPKITSPNTPKPEVKGKDKTEKTKTQSGSKESDDVSSPAKKRSRQVAPDHGSCGIETANSFAPLMEMGKEEYHSTPIHNGGAISKEYPINREQNNTSKESDNRKSKVDMPSKASTSNGRSRSHSSSRTRRLSKENFNDIKDKPSQSNKGETGNNP